MKVTVDFQKQILNWCEEILDSYELSLETLLHNHDLRDLNEWKHEVINLKEAILQEKEIDNKVLSQRASELYHRLESYFQNKSIEDNTSLMSQRSTTVPIGKHTLPPLPYEYDALEPYIDREIMRLHHDKHHQSYVDGLNKAEIEMQKARDHNQYDLIKHWEREAAFHGAGHYLHTIFWSIMSPTSEKSPKGIVLREIIDTFGSFEKFKTHFSAAAHNVEAVGWTILVWSPRSRRLEILQAEKHQNLSQWDVVPLLVLDVWEHAYYLQYKNERKKYIDNWWNIVNWKEVERRFQEAQQLKWQPF
ncbi:superoxide dismutase [Bacillus weihaiensis]|uniref:superoxide dismutase n=1 Tax=Bacillus weihaiensis TaxID=1547283 RepID=UPI000932B1A0